ncbi:hypothetical protein ACFWFQ_36345, partial [Nocardia salmonicida]
MTSASVDASVESARWPRRVRFVRIPAIGLSLRVDVVSVAITVALLVVTAVVGIWSLGASTTRAPSLGFVQVVEVPHQPSPPGRGPQSVCARRRRCGP